MNKITRRHFASEIPAHRGLNGGPPQKEISMFWKLNVSSFAKINKKIKKKIKRVFADVIKLKISR